MKRNKSTLATEILSSSLRSFLTSPRGQLLASTRVGPMIGSKSKKLVPITWDELIAILPSISATDISRIDKFLALHRPEVSMTDELEPLKRSDAQGELEDAFKELAKAPKEILSAHQVKTFLPADAPSAPFEEVLTFQQFLALGVENIIRKRGITSEKLFAFSKAIYSLLETAAPAKLVKLSPHSSAPLDPSAVVTFNFEKSHPLASIAVTGLLSGVTDGLPTEILAHLAEVISGDDLGKLLLMNDNNVEASKEIQDIFAKFDSVLKARFENLRQIIKNLLSSSGIPLSIIASLLVSQKVPTSADLVLTKLCTLAVGGRNPIFLGNTLEHLFTLTPKLGDSLVKKVKSSPDTVSDLHALLPNFPLELISEYIKGKK